METNLAVHIIYNNQERNIFVSKKYITFLDDFSFSRVKKWLTLKNVFTIRLLQSMCIPPNKFYKIYDMPVHHIALFGWI